MQATDLDKLKILREIRKEARKLTEMGYGGIRIEREIISEENADEGISGEGEGD